MSVFDPKICQDGHTDKMQCLESERDSLKAEVERLIGCWAEIDRLKAELEKQEIEKNKLWLKAEKLAEALKNTACSIADMANSKDFNRGNLKQYLDGTYERAKEALAEFDRDR